MSDIQIIQGDCLEVMKTFDDNQFDLVLTSPPYGSLRAYNGYSFDFKGVSKEIYRVINDGGICVWVVGDETTKGSESGLSFRQALHFKDIGFNIHDTMIWNKPSCPPTQHTRYQQMFEYMFVFSKGKPTCFNPLKTKCKTVGRVREKHRSGNNNHSLNGEGKYVTATNKTIGNVWDINICSERIKHPAKFPIDLARNHILSWTNDGDNVLDPFLGSGTTAVACREANRNCVGIEISEEYCNIARKRVQEEKDKMGLFNEL